MQQMVMKYVVEKYCQERRQVHVVSYLHVSGSVGLRYIRSTAFNLLDGNRL